MIYMMKSIAAVLDPSSGDQEIEVSTLLERVESLRLIATEKLDPNRRADLGQFLTPAPVARLAVSMAAPAAQRVRLLDAGAGVGSLTAAWVAHVCQRTPPQEIHAVCVEVDPLLVSFLKTTMDLCRRACAREGVKFTSEIHETDFIKFGVESLSNDIFRATSLAQCDVVIMNPPYRKINAGSQERVLLGKVGLGSTNLYTAFLLIAIRFLSSCGELVAITPRSFCNGTYFRGFRKDFLSKMAFQHIHVFEARDRAFGGDAVLQENVIFRATRSDRPPSELIISTSQAADSHDTRARKVHYSQVVQPRDPEQFIRLTTNEAAAETAAHMERMTHSLEDLGISVSTGKVVDFRVKSSLRKEPEPDAVPLIYPGHFHEGFVRWPRHSFKKANALARTPATDGSLVQAGVYVLVKRFSSKEETRRVVAAIYDPLRMPEGDVGFENHLNYFHDRGCGLSMDLAKGLTAFLNSTVLDLFFRQLSGHTQVNAGDLRNMRYPSKSQLLSLGRGIGDVFPKQEAVDQLVGEVLFAMGKSTP